MLDDVKKIWKKSLRRIEQNTRGLIVTYFFFFIASYGILWSLLEPLDLEISGIGFLLFVILIAAHLTLAVEILTRRRRDYIRFRKDFWKEISLNISKANDEVIFIGGISSSLLDSEHYALFTESLIRSSDLRLEFYYESSDNLFRRAQYCERPLQQSDLRTFIGMLKRKSDIERISEEIRVRAEGSREIAPKKKRDILNRIIIREMHLQFYMIVTKIDDIIYLTSISNRRNSNSPTIRITDKSDLFYKMALEYISYIKAENHGNPYCTPPGEEILQIFDNKGIARGFCARETVRKITQLRVKVIFGFVFDEKGKLLLQQRADRARDNRLLWDKSFGGHMNSEQDTSIIETARREFLEELLDECFHQETLYHLGQWNSENLDYSHDFKLGKFLLFNLYNDPVYNSTRIVDEHGSRNNVNLSFNVTAVMIFCPDRQSIRNSSDVAKHMWISIPKLKERIRSEEGIHTPDLINIVETKIEELEQISESIKNYCSS